MQATFKYRDSSGNIKEGYMTLDDYRLAADHNMRTAAVVNARHADADPNFGSAFEQGCKYLGIFPKGDRKYGIMPTTIKHILDGTCTQQLSGFQLAGGTIVSPKGPIGGSTPASRLFFPEVVLAFMDSELNVDFNNEQSIFNRLFAMNSSIASEVFTQPIIDVTAPRAQDARIIGQNSLPTNMISITASQYSKAMGAVSLGLSVSDQAQRDATLDLVAIVLREQAYGQRMRHLWTNLNMIVNGNPDAGESALVPVPFTDYDPSAGAGEITHEGYIKMCWDPNSPYSWSMAFGPIDSYLAIERRSGRPLSFDPNTGTVNVGDAGTYGINPGTPRLLNFNASAPDFFVVPDGVVSAGHLVLIDPRYAMASVTNTAASYQAVEQMVLQRTTMFRFDMSTFQYRLREDALKLVDFNNTSS